ncbi:MAG: hypothetical protein LBC19_08135 [Tannerella sp.]|jgi:hypothetical protein|nr:hypothetical protein [Tannerella sp.]
MKKYALICVCALWGISSVWGQTVVTGYVYEDLNRNGKKDRNEKGIAQTAVSNGKEVFLTDAKGKYQLPVGNDNIIFVIKPSGYQAPLNEYNLPETYKRRLPILFRQPLLFWIFKINVVFFIKRFAIYKMTCFYKIPCVVIALATFMNPAILAPFT